MHIYIYILFIYICSWAASGDFRRRRAPAAAAAAALGDHHNSNNSNNNDDNDNDNNTKPGRIKRAALSLQNQNYYICCFLMRTRLYASDGPGEQCGSLKTAGAGSGKYGWGPSM